MTEPTQIADALTLPYLNHAARMLAAGYATAGDIDNAMRFGCGYPQGPLTAIDDRGASSVVAGLDARFAESGHSLHRPADVLRQAAEDGTTLAAAGDGDAAAPQLRREITRIGVVGTGTMASGIVQVFAQSGFDVLVVGRSQEKIDGVTARITKTLDKAVSKGKLDEAGKEATLARISGAIDREELAGLDLVVEAIAEDLAIKTELFADLDRICKDGAILATTTSSMPIGELAKATGRPADVIGMHFFNPAPMMKLVEVVTTDDTAEEVDETVKALCAATKKVAVSCGDRAGFIVNCLLFPYLNDAIAWHESGEEMATIDTAIKEQVGFPMGPFELLDVVGTDVALAILTELEREFDEPGFAPAELLRTKVADGHLGRKTGRGFHDYGG